MTEIKQNIEIKKVKTVGYLVIKFIEKQKKKKNLSVSDLRGFSFHTSPPAHSCFPPFIYQNNHRFNHTHRYWFSDLQYYFWCRYMTYVLTVNYVHTKRSLISRQSHLAKCNKHLITNKLFVEKQLIAKHHAWIHTNGNNMTN